MIIYLMFLTIGGIISNYIPTEWLYVFGCIVGIVADNIWNFCVNKN